MCKIPQPGPRIIQTRVCADNVVVVVGFFLCVCCLFVVFFQNSPLLLLQFYAHVEEAEWAIETMKEFNKPVACTMRICTVGDMDGVSPGDCAVRMVKAGKLLYVKTLRLCQRTGRTCISLGCSWFFGLSILLKNRSLE